MKKIVSMKIVGKPENDKDHFALGLNVQTIGVAEDGEEFVWSGPTMKDIVITCPMDGVISAQVTLLLKEIDIEGISVEDLFDKGKSVSDAELNSRKNGYTFHSPAKIVAQEPVDEPKPPTPPENIDFKL